VYQRVLAAVVAIASLSVAGNAGAQLSNASPATDFRFDSAFALDPPDPAYWEPPIRRTFTGAPTKPEIALAYLLSTAARS
jgi:hypothetical protein